jgi:hypothetical protein
MTGAVRSGGADFKGATFRSASCGGFQGKLARFPFCEQADGTVETTSAA